MAWIFFFLSAQAQPGIELISTMSLPQGSEITCTGPNVQFTLKIGEEIMGFSEHERENHATVSGTSSDLDIPLDKAFGVVDVSFGSRIYAHSADPARPDSYELEIEIDPSTKAGRFSAVNYAKSKHAASAFGNEATPVSCKF